MFSLGKSGSSGSGNGSTAHHHHSGIGSLSKKSPIIFDIRIASSGGNVKFMSGSALDSEPTVLHGDIVFSLPETLHVKRITLRLIGKFKLEFLQVGQHKNTNLASIVKEDQTIFEAFWQNLLVDKEGIILKGSSAGSGNSSSQGSVLGVTAKPILSRVRSVPMINTGKKKSHKSDSPGVLKLPSNGVSGTPYNETMAPSGSSFILPPGNYELPFQISLPQDTPETVEGLQSGSVLYTMECSIERQGFNKANFTKYEYLRIFRTLKPDDMAIQEEVYVGKNWPNKLQYEISIPSRAIPIGGATPINVKIYPFQKGYKLRRITASLIQHYEFKDSAGEVYDDENVIQKQMLTKFDDIPGCDSSRDNLLIDEVKINSVIQFPDDLKRATQDCDVADDLIKVRHKLQVVLNLRRDVIDEASGSKPYEQSTDIKVNLPIKLYVMKHVPIQGRLVLLDHFGKLHFRPGQFCTLFEPSTDSSALGISSNNSSSSSGGGVGNVNNVNSTANGNGNGNGDEDGNMNANSNLRGNRTIRRLEDGSYSVQYFPERDTQAPPSYESHWNDVTIDPVTRSLPTTPLRQLDDVLNGPNPSPSYFDLPTSDARIQAPQPNQHAVALGTLLRSHQPRVPNLDHLHHQSRSSSSTRLSALTAAAAAVAGGSSVPRATGSADGSTTAASNGSTTPASREDFLNHLQRLPSYDESRARYESVSREPTPLYFPIQQDQQEQE